MAPEGDADTASSVRSSVTEKVTTAEEVSNDGVGDGVGDGPRPPWWRRRSVLAELASGAALVGLLVVVYFPGSVTPDTVDMCGQAVAGVFNDWHSPILAGAWGFVRVGAATLWVTQTVLFVAGLAVLLRPWLRPSARIVATWLIVCFPATVAWVGHLGKDNWFAVAMIWMIVSAAAGTRAAGRARLWWALGAVVWAWLAVAARPNGIVPVAAVLLVVLPMPAWSGRRPVLRLVGRAALAGLAVVAVFLTTTVWEKVVVSPRASYPQQVSYGFDLAGLSEATGELLLPDVAFTRPTTLEEVDEYFDPRAGAAYYYGEGTPVAFGTRAYDREAIDELAAAWRSAVTEYPLAWLRLRATYTAALLGWSGPHPYKTIVDPGVDPAVWAGGCPMPDRLAPGVNESVTSALLELETTHIWRGWTFLLALVVGSAIAGWRRVVESRGIAMAGVVSILSVGLAGGTTTFRYSWFTAICALVAVALACSRIPALAAVRPGSDAHEAPSPDGPVDDEPAEGGPTDA